MSGTFIAASAYAGWSLLNERFVTCACVSGASAAASALAASAGAGDAGAVRASE